MHRTSQWIWAGVLALAAGAPQWAHAAAAPVPGAPAGWVHEDIGGPGAAGDSKVTGSGPTAVWTVSGSGADIQNAADQFQYAYTMLTGDGGITARILSQTPSDASWTKTGVMLRESDAAGSRMATMNYTSANGLEGGSRQDTDGAWSGPPGSSGVDRHNIGGAPLWLRVQHKGTDFQVMSSNDGQLWRMWGHTTVAMDLTKPILAGLCVTAHNDGSLASATFDNVSVDNNVIAPAPVGPSGLDATPGNGAVLLSYNGAPGAVGYNIYRSVSGDLTDPPVLVNATPTPYTWFIDDGAGKGLANGTNYLYEVRGVLMDSTGKMSETLGSDLVTATPNPPVLGGLVVRNIGTFNPGTATVDATKDLITVHSAGSDIWDNVDSQTFVGTSVAGDFTLTAKLPGPPTGGDQTNQPGYGKIGLEMRTGLENDAPYAMVFASVMRDPEVMFEGHFTPEGTNTASATTFSAGTTNFADLKFPVWIRLSRSGTMMTAQQSEDGTSFTNVTDPQDFSRLPLITYVGIGATAHDDHTYVDGQIVASSLTLTTP